MACPSASLRDAARGDRLQTTADGTVTRYALDVASGLTQVLSDGTTAYLYGQGRTGEEGPAGWSYHLADGLGSARQLAGPVGAIARTQSFAPFGALLSATGEGSSAFGSQTIASYDYAYDRRGNRTRALESLVPAGWAPDLPYKVYLPLVLQNAGPGLAPSGVAPSAATTIDYAYDPLGRLVSADYSSGEFFHYGYDATGNRLSERTHQGETLYTYDAAQRLTSAGGVAYTWEIGRAHV